LRSPYWDWTPRAAAEESWPLFCGTAPTHQPFGLRAALTMLLQAEGLEGAWARPQPLARAGWPAGSPWGQGVDIARTVAAPAARGRAVTSVRIGGGGADRLRQWCTREAGVTLGIGLGMEPAGDWLRIAHMGHVNAHMTLGVIATVEAG